MSNISVHVLRQSIIRKESCKETLPQDAIQQWLKEHKKNTHVRLKKSDCTEKVQKSEK